MLINSPVDRPVDNIPQKLTPKFSSVDSIVNSSQWTINTSTGRPIKVGGRVDKFQRRHKPETDITDDTSLPTGKRFKY